MTTSIVQHKKRFSHSSEHPSVEKQSVVVPIMRPAANRNSIDRSNASFISPALLRYAIGERAYLRQHQRLLA